MVREVLRAHLPELKVQIGDQTRGYKQLHGLTATTRAIRMIAQTGVLKREVEAALSFAPLVTAVGDQLTAPNELADGFILAIQDLQASAALLSRVLVDLIHEEDPNSIFVKMPDSLDWKHASKLIEDVCKTLEQIVVRDSVDGQVTLGQFDTGSRYFQVLLRSYAALALVAFVARAVVEYQGALIQLDVQRKAAEEFAVHADNRMELSESFTEMWKAAVRAERNRIVDRAMTQAGAPTDDHDYRSRMEHAFEQFQEWSEQGVEIYPALTAPLELRLSFPDAKELIETGLLPAPQLTGPGEAGTADGNDEPHS